MQDDLDTNHPSLNISLLSINKIAAESGANSLSPDMDLPMVQDTSSLSIWNSWGGAWRDVWILDETNSPYAVVSLTTYNLGTGFDEINVTGPNYDGLKALLVGAATGVPCEDVEHDFDPTAPGFTCY